mgnify:CR=1 FL=1
MAKKMLRGIKTEQIVNTVIAGVAVALIVKFVSRFLKKDLAKEVDNIRVGSSLTLSDNEIIMAANDLFQAMDRWGTDEATIWAVLERCRTKDDLLAVIKQFWTKPYNGLGHEDTMIGKLWFSDEKDLRGWLKAELNKKETEKCREYFNKLGVSF